MNNPPDKPYLSLVVPVYEGAGHLPEWREKLLEVIGNLPESCEILLIDDGSSDQSWKIISGWADNDSRFRAFGLSRNFGQHPAMHCGFDRCRGEVVMTLDDDLQIPHSVIPEFLERIRQGADIVAGVRTRRYDGFFRRQLPSWFLNKFMRNISGSSRRDFGCNHIAYRRWVIDAIREAQDRYRFVPELVTWAGGHLEEIEVPHCSGVSRYNFFRLLKLNLELLTQYNFWSLYLAISVIGVLMIILAVILGPVMFFTTEAMYAFDKFGFLALIGIGIALFLVAHIAFVSRRLVVETARRPLYIVHPDRIRDFR